MGIVVLLAKLITLVLLGLSVVDCLTCFKCNNGNALKPNFNCPAEGNVMSGIQVSCSGKCFIRTRHHGDEAVVERGCFKMSWMKNLIKNGCDVIEQDIWCFCDSDGCNGKRLGDWFPIS